MLSMLENPQFQSTMNEALQNPAMIDMMIQQNPMLRDMGPGVRQMMQSPEFRRMLTDPNSIRQAMQLQRAMGGLGGGAGGGGSFPAPGVTNTTPDNNSNGSQNTAGAGAGGAAPPVNPFMPGALGAGNPFAALFGGGGNAPNAGSTTEGQEATEGQQNNNNPLGFLLNPGGATGGVNPFDPQQNPFLRDPSLMTQFAQTMGGGQANEGGGGGGGGATNPLAALLAAGGGGNGGLFGASPPDNRPPEERYAVQLGQLNDMGFYEFERNIEALRRAGGSVQGAVEYLLSHP